MRRWSLIALLALLVGAALAFGQVLTPALANSVTAGSTVWFASKKQVSRELTYHWTTSDGFRVRISRCRGMGRSMTRGGVVLYHRFACAEVDYANRIIYVRVSITGPKVGNERVVEIRCDNTYSDYECP
jgi:hypothetical protein